MLTVYVVEKIGFALAKLHQVDEPGVDAVDAVNLGRVLDDEAKVEQVHKGAPFRDSKNRQITSHVDGSVVVVDVDVLAAFETGELEGSEFSDVVAFDVELGSHVLDGYTSLVIYCMTPVRDQRSFTMTQELPQILWNRVCSERKNVSTSQDSVYSLRSFVRNCDDSNVRISIHEADSL